MSASEGEQWSPSPALSPEQMLERFAAQSAVSRVSPEGTEIDRLLREFDLDVAYWSFTRASQSCYGRDRKTCPAFNFGLRRNADFEALALKRGNWDDDWPQTADLRSGLNAILEGAGYDADYVSDQTFIFAASWEAQALQSMAYRAKAEVLELIRREFPRRWPFLRSNQGLQSIYFGSYWGEEKPGPMGQYNLLFAGRAEMLRGQERAGGLREAIADFLRKVDVSGHCTRHDVGLGFWYSGQPDLPPLYRED